MYIYIYIYILQPHISQYITKLFVKVTLCNVIYLLEYLLCKMQYVRKSETPFNIRFNIEKI